MFISATGDAVVRAFFIRVSCKRDGGGCYFCRQAQWAIRRATSARNGRAEEGLVLRILGTIATEFSPLERSAHGGGVGVRRESDDVGSPRGCELGLLRRWSLVITYARSAPLKDPWAWEYLVPDPMRTHVGGGGVRGPEEVVDWSLGPRLAVSTLIPMGFFPLLRPRRKHLA